MKTEMEVILEKRELKERFEKLFEQIKVTKKKSQRHLFLLNKLKCIERHSKVLCKKQQKVFRGIRDKFWRVMDAYKEDKHDTRDKIEERGPFLPEGYRGV